MNPATHIDSCTDHQGKVAMTTAAEDIIARHARFRIGGLENGELPWCTPGPAGEPPPAGTW
ncbi:hypothetical protein [Kitasatospora sp. NPDC051914]|uniref:hypothetical protein n=1 Tax=Kitasatospora sp. NPDC051914 TaxID=3154945 RepID=UPI003418C309